MEKIIIVWRFKEGEKKARLRFRLRDGRAVDVFHKSNIVATVSDLDKFEVNGELKPRVTIYNKDLFEKAGIADVPTTPDEFKEACRKLKDAGIQPTLNWMKEVLKRNNMI